MGNKTLKDKQNNLCFYTGLPMTSKAGMLNTITREHLIPSTYANISIIHNIVMCGERMNSIVGNAPLSVKFKVKDETRKFIATLPENVSNDEKLNLGVKKAKEIMKEFIVCDADGKKIGYPWQWKNVKNQQILYMHWLALLTPEEKALYSLDISHEMKLKARAEYIEWMADLTAARKRRVNFKYLPHVNNPHYYHAA